MVEPERAQTRPFPKKNRDLIYRMATDRWQTQQQQVDSLDAKLGNLLGFGSALVAILAGFLALKEGCIPLPALVLLAISLALYLGIAGNSLSAYYLRRWESGPPLEIAWQHAREYDEENMVWWAAERFTKSYENNQGNIKCKIRAVRANFILITLQTLALTTGLVLVALR